jgi:hypothetical protein
MRSMDVLSVVSLLAVVVGLLVLRARPSRPPANGWRLPLTADFSTLEDREPMLAAMLESATVEGSGPHPTLSLEPWDGGTLRSYGGRFRHRGMFFEPRDGNVGFLFVLENVADDSSVTYSGVLRAGGRQITYSTVRRSSRSAPGEKIDGVWQTGT